MKALVTGGAGFIGSNLIEALVDEHEVCVLDNFHTGSMNNLKEFRNDIQIIKDSCNNCPSLNLKPDIIFHLGIPSSSPMYKSNPFLTGEALKGMISIMELARRSKCRKVVFASTSSLYFGVPTPQREDAHIAVTDYYIEARLAMEWIAELYYKLYGIDYAGLRFFSVYGPREESKGRLANEVSRFLSDMRDGKAPIIYGNGSQTRDFIYVNDAIDAIILASNKGTGIFNVGTGKSYSFNCVVELLNSKLGTEIKPQYRENHIKNYIMHTQADISKTNILGFKAKFSLGDGVDQLSRNNP